MSEYLLPFLVAFRPGMAARRIPHVVAWWRPFGSVVVIAVLVSLFSHGYAVEQTLSHLPPTATPDDRIQVRDWLNAGLPARTLLIPIRLAAEYGSIALIILAFSRALTGRRVGSYRGFFVLSVSAGLIPYLGQFAAILLAGSGTGGSTASLFSPFSIAALLPPTGEYGLNLLLTAINLITLWSVGSVTTGVTVLCRCKAWKAVLVAVAAWTVYTALSISALSLLRNTFHFGL
jgi:hypothetical protein